MDAPLESSYNWNLEQTEKKKLEQQPLRIQIEG